jgi:hypothetical protein
LTSNLVFLDRFRRGFISRLLKYEAILGLCDDIHRIYLRYMSEIKMVVEEKEPAKVRGTLPNREG